MMQESNSQLKRKKSLVLLIIFLFFWLILSGPSAAIADEDSQHYNTIINQVRGDECCSPGKLSFFRQQINTLADLKLPATFTFRFDALNDPQYIVELRRANNDLFEWGAFLEITPSLAAAAEVEYLASDDNWYQANYVYLIGYSQGDREKLLAAYMTRYQEIFGHYPKTATAWMIDSFSLQKLKTEYGVEVVQITREQFGTDSYTLYGGPAHYPYWPSNNWALIPFQTNTEQGVVNETMPLIVRQTITDPVFNYGDQSNSFTSQPNDYMQRKVDFDYFRKIFDQAHEQAQMDWSFSLLGLENSMEDVHQAEYSRQLAYVAEWQKRSNNNHTLTAKDLATVLDSRMSKIKADEIYPQIYAGQNDSDANNAAWWVGTDQYRLRLRLSNQELYISDIRVYEQNFFDPYQAQAAKNAGFWVVPFLIDGSRYFYQDESRNLQSLANDQLNERKSFELSPMRLLLAKNVKAEDLQLKTVAGATGKEYWLELNQEILAKFINQQFYLPENLLNNLDSDSLLENNLLLDKTVNNLVFYDRQGQLAWGLKNAAKDNHLQGLKVEVNSQFNSLETASNYLTQLREEHQPLLFPELREQEIDPGQSYLYINNDYALADRNPVRLVLFPMDRYGYPITIEEEPEIITDPAVDTISLMRQSNSNGMLFIDLSSREIQKSQVTIRSGQFQHSLNVYFAPNCKTDWAYCLKNPAEASWYLRAKVGDYKRQVKDYLEKHDLPFGL